MHLNYFFLRKLAAALKPRVEGTVLLEAFSQDKDEIVLKFGREGREVFVIRALLKTDFTCLYFPERFERARANSVDLFKELQLQEVKNVQMHENERAFVLLFERGEKLLFKMFGNRSNLLYYAPDATIPAAVFNRRLKPDLYLEEDTLSRTLDMSFERFVELEGDYRKQFPTFGKLVYQYLSERISPDTALDERWAVIQDVMNRLEEGRYFITLFEGVTTLSLLEIGEVQQVFTDPIEAVNAYCLHFLRVGHLQKEKSDVIRNLRKRISQTENYLAAAYEKLAEISDTGKNEQLGNLLMANLHRVEPRAEFIDVENFYTGGMTRIRLKPDISPAKNAEIYFRKARNEKLEVAHLQQNIEGKEADLARWQEWLTAIEGIATVKELRAFVRQHQVTQQFSADAPEIKFRKEQFMGYEIFIGKSARNNDELTLKYAGKEDLWLHAKDVAGSHVIIRNIPGRKIPPMVIERAAELAAWHSKRRNDSLCPVSVTPKKFVRKAKGLPAGAVIVEKESVVMVVPKP